MTVWKRKLFRLVSDLLISLVALATTFPYIGIMTNNHGRTYFQGIRILFNSSTATYGPRQCPVYKKNAPNKKKSSTLKD